MTSKQWSFRGEWRKNGTNKHPVQVNLHSQLEESKISQGTKWDLMGDTSKRAKQQRSIGRSLRRSKYNTSICNHSKKQGTLGDQFGRHETYEGAPVQKGNIVGGTRKGWTHKYHTGTHGWCWESQSPAGASLYREYQRQQELLPLHQQYKDEQGKCGFVAKTGDSSLISLQHFPLPCVKGARHWQKAI